MQPLERGQPRVADRRVLDPQCLQCREPLEVPHSIIGQAAPIQCQPFKPAQVLKAGEVLVGQAGSRKIYMMHRIERLWEPSVEKPPEPDASSAALSELAAEPFYYSNCFAFPAKRVGNRNRDSTDAYGECQQEKR